MIKRISRIIMRTKDDIEKSVKKQLIESVKVIKNKLKRMRNEEDDTALQLNKVFKPITEPLNVIANGQSNLSELKNMELSNKDDKLHKNRRSSAMSSLSEDSDSISSRSLKSACSDDNSFRNNDIVVKPEQSVSHGDNISSDNLKPAGGDDNSFKNKDIVTKTELRNLRNMDLSLESYSELDIPFGIRRVGKELMIGNTKVEFFNNETALGSMHLINIGGIHYELTDGLREVLFRKTPDLSLITEKDKIAYKDILILTNAHKRNYEANSQIRGDKGIKYNKIIKPLFFYVNQNDTKGHKLGGGILPKLKTYRTYSDLTYWDDPNELIERLQLLMASKDAGNNNHDNEIISIIEELKEAGIIKE